MNNFGLLTDIELESISSEANCQLFCPVGINCCTLKIPHERCKTANVVVIYPFMYLHLTHVQFAAAASDEQMTIHLEDNVDLHQQHGMACQLAMYQMTAPASDPQPLPYPTTQSPIPDTYAAFPPGRSVPPAAPAPCWTPDICTCCSGRCVLFCVSPGDSQSHGGPSIRRHLFASLRRRSTMLRSVPVDLQ